MGAPAPYNTSFDITPLIAFTEEDGTVNPLNISQFLGIEQKTSNLSLLRSASIPLVRLFVNDVNTWTPPVDMIMASVVALIVMLIRIGAIS